MQRYFVTKENINDKLSKATIKGKDVHHIKDVMRMKVGESIILCTDDLCEYVCNITSIGNVIDLDIISTSVNSNELKCTLTIAQGMVHKNKIEEVVRRICELGASSFVSVQMSRSNTYVKKKDDYRFDRFETIIKEACEQSERGKLLKHFGFMSFKEFIEFSKSFDVLLVCYENDGRNNKSHLVNVLNEIGYDNLINKKILVIVGPEGGFDPSEIDNLINNGFRCFGLGPRILRTETAPLMVCSVIASFLDK